MILVSHRGNIDGRIPELENQPDYINNAIECGYDVEVDIWRINDQLFLGHDNAKYPTNMDWLMTRASKLWIHCKNVEAIVYLNLSATNKYNYFWHQEDTLTLTSHQYIWAYTGKQPIKNSIAVLPELHNDNISDCIGICSDIIQNYK